MEHKMYLTPEQEEMLGGAQGEVIAKVMRTMVMYGDAFDADKMVPIDGPAHLVTSFGISIMGAVFDVMQELIDAGIRAKEPFTVDPRPIDNENVPASFVQKVVAGVMYGDQRRYEKQLRALGLRDGNAFTCTCYLPEVGNTPKRGDVLSWAESSAVVYANSVLGARCNRNSAFIDLFGAILGFVPNFGLLTDDGRKASWVVKVQTSRLPDAQVLGSAIGLRVMDEVPYILGLDTFFGRTMNDEVRSYLKDMGAAAASNGAVGLFHVDKLTPEAADLGKTRLTRRTVREYIIDDAELERVESSYPIMWADPNASPKLAFIGCPHLTMRQLCSWSERIARSLNAAGRRRVAVQTVLSAAPDVLREFAGTEYANILANTGARTTYICPLMYMNNPKCKDMPVATCSNKLRTYTSARYFGEEALLNLITTGRVL